MSKNDNFHKNSTTRKNEARTVRKIVAIIISFFILILIVGSISGYIYIKSALEPVDPNSNEEIDIEIPMGSSSSTIASILEENGIINNALIFRFYIKFNNESDFQAGNYTLTPSMEMNEIITALKNGKVIAEPVYTITIPEGLTVEQMAEILAEELPFTKEKFLQKVNDRKYIQELIDKYHVILSEDILQEGIHTPLEGYLSAATYAIYEEDPTIESIVEDMLEQTQNVLIPYLNAIDEKGWTVHEGVTLASLIEEETGKIDQRNKISGVFYNRLDIGMPLQTDPTLAYAAGEHLGKTLIQHTKIDSPYNTYQIKGLPIGPIANFAESSMEAVVNPENSNYLYFLHDQEGKVHFAESLEEHNQNKYEYIN